MDDKRLSEIRARADAATPGPWKMKWYKGCACECDAYFITHARTDIPDLLAEVERLREVAGLAEGRRECAQSHHDRISQMLANQNAGLVVMARERDEARREVERMTRSLNDIVRDAEAVKLSLDEAGREFDALVKDRDDARAEVDALRNRVHRVERVLADVGCDCDCGCFVDEHSDDCERCVACKVEQAMNAKI